MKTKNYFLRFLFIFSVFSIIIGCASNSTKNANQNVSIIDTSENKSITTKTTKDNSVDIKFIEFYPFPENSVTFGVADNNTTMIINGTSKGSFGLSREQEISLNGNNTLEVEIVELGNSRFHEGESGNGAGDGKMLKVFISKTEDVRDLFLQCIDAQMRSSAGDFIYKGTGKFEYNLESLDKIYKLGFSFYNASLDGFKIKARLIKKE